MARTINQNKIKKEMMKKLNLTSKELKNTMLFNYFDYLSQFEVVWDYNKVSYDDIFNREKSIDNLKCFNSVNWNAIIPAIQMFFSYKYRNYMLISFYLGGDIRCDNNYTLPMILPFNKDDFLEIDTDFILDKKYGNYIYRISGGFSENNDIYYENLYDSNIYGYLNDEEELIEEHETFLELCLDSNFNIFFQ